MLFKHHILIKIFTLVIIFLSNAAYIGVVVCIQQLSEVETSSPLYITESIYVSVYDSQPISDYFWFHDVDFFMNMCFTAVSDGTPY